MEPGAHVPSTLRIAWRNLGRNGKRTALAVFAIALAQLAVLWTDGVMNAWIDAMLHTMTGPMLGHVQVHAPRWRHERAMEQTLDRVDERLEALRAMPEVASASARIYTGALVAKDVDGEAALIVALEPEHEAESGLLEGIDRTGLPEGHDVLVGATFARQLGVSEGDELVVLGQAIDGSIANDLFRVRGILHTPVEEIDRRGVVMTLAAAQETFAMPGRAHELTVRLRDADAADGMATRIAAQGDFEGLDVASYRALAPELTEMIDLAGVYGLVVLALVMLAAAAGVANTMLMATFERRRELGTLLAIGATPTRMVTMVLAEAVVTGLVGVALGTLLGGGLVLYEAHVGIDVAALGGSDAGSELAMYGVATTAALHPWLRPADVIVGFVGVTVVSLLAALWPALATARLEPVQAMRS